MEKRESKEKKIDFEKVLSDMIQSNQQYFGGKNSGKYIRPASRYEAWMCANALSNLVIIEKLNLILNKGK